MYLQATTLVYAFKSDDFGTQNHISRFKYYPSGFILTVENKVVNNLK